LKYTHQQQRYNVFYRSTSHGIVAENFHVATVLTQTHDNR